MDQIGQAKAEGQNQRADRPKIDPATHQAEGRTVQPNFSAPGLLGPDKQHQSRRQPEQQIQRRAQQRDSDPGPQYPEQVIDDPHGTSQKQRLAQCTCLLSHIDCHPPNSRPNSPPRSGASFS